VPQLKTEIFVPEIANAVPHLRVHLDAGGITPMEADRRLGDGEPRIEIRGTGPSSLEIAVWTLKSGEAEIVGDRLAQVLKKG
jgi:L-seryl-tRNA(Ser) seleniumtransferase